MFLNLDIFYIEYFFKFIILLGILTFIYILIFFIFKNLLILKSLLSFRFEILCFEQVLFRLYNHKIFGFFIFKILLISKTSFIIISLICDRKHLIHELERFLLVLNFKRHIIWLKKYLIINRAFFPCIVVNSKQLLVLILDKALRLCCATDKIFFSLLKDTYAFL